MPAENSFNQTRMELKHLMTQINDRNYGAFNQTRMELKPGKRRTCSSSSMNLLIRPEWNWNEQYKAIFADLHWTFNQTRMELKLL